MTHGPKSGLALGAFCLVGAISGGALASETRDEDRRIRNVATMAPAYGADPLAETADRIRMVLAAERAALETLATDRAFAFAAAPPDDPSPIPSERSALAAQVPDLEALSAEDEVAAALARGASDEMIEELLLGDAAGAVDLSAIERMSSGGGGDDEWRCLSEAIYFEARGESLAGQVAVGEVVLNRVDDARFPLTICGVTHQGARDGVLHSCQFSYECDGEPETIADREAFARAGKIAHLLMEGRPRVLTQAATFYHAISVRPGWARRLVRSARIGDHIFYRRPTQLSSSE